MPGRLANSPLTTDTNADGRPLSPRDREQLLRPYLPAGPSSTPSSRRTSRRRKPENSNKPSVKSRRQYRSIRSTLAHLLHLFLFWSIHLVFDLYLRLRKLKNALLDRAQAVLYHHHRTPELIKRDVGGLKKVPQHLSVVLSLESSSKSQNRSETGAYEIEVGDGMGGVLEEDSEAVERLVADVAEIAAWCTCAGIGFLSVYERSGTLKPLLPHLRTRILNTLQIYHGSASPPLPTLTLRTPHQEPLTNLTPSTPPQTPHLTLLLLSAQNSRQTLTDLTKTLTTLSQNQQISPQDITTELIDSELTASVMGEPDLLLLFGERVCLDGYPPWQVRLTEMSWRRDHRGGVGYAGFLRGLRGFAGVEGRFGR
ncbi:hypothetical protein MBLNU230_g5297t1 [Neophaeotheca triangularis]